MKKNLFMVAAVALMALTACTKENVNEGGAQAPEMPAPSYYVEFTAEAANDDAAATPSAPSSAQSKTTFDETAKKTLWSSDDLISVNGKKFKVDKLIEGGLKARFINAEELGEDFGAPFTAIYPYDATQGQAEVPAVQTVSAGSFAEESVVTVAYSAEDNTLSFKHVNSLLKFQVSAACDEVTIISDDALAGTIKVNGVTTENVDYSILDAKKEVTVNGPFVTGKDYYVAVLPGEKTNFKVYVDGYYSKGAASVTPQRSKVMNMKTLPEPLRKVYVKNDLYWEDLAVYAWGENGELLGTWPGTKVSNTETVNGKTYNVIDFQGIDDVATGIIITGKASNGSKDVEIKTSDIVSDLKGDKYYRLSIRDGLYKEVNPLDETTFGYRIFVFMQKGDNYVDPCLHIWDTNGIANTSWNNQLKMTDKYEYPGYGNKTFYYYEPPTSAYSSMNFIVTLNNGTKQTGDIKGKLTSDYYVCAWAESASNCGLYARKDENTTKDNNSITSTYIGRNPELCY